MKKKLAEGPTIAESYSTKDGIVWKGIVWKHRLNAHVIDAEIPRRMYEPPMHTDSFLNYLEFRMNQKSTLVEKIFGKRFIK